MQARIYKPTKSTMQSGNKRSNIWLIDFPVPLDARNISPVMGWTSSKNMMNEIKLEFTSLEEAVNFAESNSYEYSVIQPLKHNIIKKKYPA